MNDMVFWVVWESDSGRSRYENSSEKLAIGEAKRLARQDTEKCFYMLKAISRFEVIDRPVPVAETILTEPR